MGPVHLNQEVNCIFFRFRFHLFNIWLFNKCSSSLLDESETQDACKFQNYKKNPFNFSTAIYITIPNRCYSCRNKITRGHINSFVSTKSRSGIFNKTSCWLRVLNSKSHSRNPKYGIVIWRIILNLTYSYPNTRIKMNKTSKW